MSIFAAVDLVDFEYNLFGKDRGHPRTVSAQYSNRPYDSEGD